MTSDSAAERRRRAAEEAASWLVTLRSENLSLSQRQEFVEWLRESPVHIAEMLRVTRVQGVLASFNGWADISLGELKDPEIVVPFPPRAALLNQPSQPLYRKGRLGIAVAASVVMAMIVAMVFALRPADSTIRTTAGQRSEVSLADESVVEVAPSTTLHVRFAEKERHVVIDGGQAYFHVHKDASRPFIVDASAARIRAVGTAFNVDRTDTGVIVTVAEGRVAVSANARKNETEPLGQSGKDGPVMLAADQRLTVFADGTISAVRQIDAETAIVWTTGQLDFDDQTIGDVLRRFNAFNHVQIDVRDPALIARRITGTFRLVDPESFASFIQATIPGAVIRRERNLIVISIAPPVNNPPGTL